MNVIYECVGLRQVTFKGSDGNMVSGTNLFFTYEDVNVSGVATEKVFIPSDKLFKMSYAPSVGSTCQLVYNKYGKVADIIPG